MIGSRFGSEEIFNKMVVIVLGEGIETQAGLRAVVLRVFIIIYLAMGSFLVFCQSTPFLPPSTRSRAPVLKQPPSFWAPARLLIFAQKNTSPATCEYYW